MKKIVYAVMATLSGLVLLLSYRTSLEAVAPTALEPTSSDASTTSAEASSPSPDPSPSATGDTPDGADAAETPAASTPTDSAGGLADGTYTGDAANTRYGPVQVQITVSGGVIADVQAIDYPDGNGRDREINARAIPVLVSETVQAQSADIDMVSGATYTSDGYLTSLQSAIDQATS